MQESQRQFRNSHRCCSSANSHLCLRRARRKRHFQENRSCQTLHSLLKNVISPCRHRSASMQLCGTTLASVHGSLSESSWLSWFIPTSIHARIPAAWVVGSTRLRRAIVTTVTIFPFEKIQCFGVLPVEITRGRSIAVSHDQCAGTVKPGSGHTKGIGS